jgi:hypothetical protein
MPLRSAHLDDPLAIRALGREMQLQREVADVGRKRRVERAACIHHEGITFGEKRADLPESRVGDPWPRSLCDQKAYAVAANATRFGWLARLQFCRQVKVERRVRDTRIQRP